MSVCLPVPIFLPISICLSCYINIYLYMFLHISLSISPAIYLSFCVSIWPTFFCWTVQLRVPLTVTLLSTADMSTLRPTRTHALFFSSFTSLSSSHHVITVSKHVITLNGNHVISDPKVMFQFFFLSLFPPLPFPYSLLSSGTRWMATSRGNNHWATKILVIFVAPPASVA